MKATSYTLLACVLSILALANSAFGTVINFCLAENGGTLVDGVEAIRDGDCQAVAHQIYGQSGELWDIIVFPECDIDYVRYRVRGICYQYDGDAVASNYVYLKIGPAWISPIYSYAASQWEDHDSGCVLDDNGGAGWANVTGMKLWSTIYGSDTGSASVQHYEMQAWGVPEPATIGLFSIAALGLLRRRKGVRR